MKVLRKIPSRYHMPDLQVGDAVLICGHIRNWIVTQPETMDPCSFEAACSEYGLKTFFRHLITAVYRGGVRIWKDEPRTRGQRV